MPNRSVYLARDGFTLAELTICALITLLLGGLFLSALCPMRETSRRKDCADRLRSILMATHEFHDVNRRLPPAALHEDLVMASPTFYEDLNKTTWTSALGFILPYLGMGPLTDSVPEIAFDLYARLDDELYMEIGYSWPPDFADIGVPLGARIPLFECPSDNINEIDYPNGGIRDATLVAYVPRWDGEKINDTDWAGYAMHFEDGSRIMRTNFTACIGAHGHQLTPDRIKWKGSMSTRGRVTLETIQDGTSKTIMFAENIGSIFNGVRGLDLDDDDPTRTETGFAWSHFWGGTCQGRGNIPYLQERLTVNIKGYGPNDPDPVNPELIPMLGNYKFSSVRGFGSMHADGVNMGFADGHVSCMNRAINWMSLYEFCGARDGGTPV